MMPSIDDAIANLRAEIQKALEIAAKRGYGEGFEEGRRAGHREADAELNARYAKIEEIIGKDGDVEMVDWGLNGLMKDLGAEPKW